MEMKRILAIALFAALAWTSAQAADISGAGATFPYPIYSKWAAAYKTQTGVGLNYQSIGSGGGIKQIKAKTVTFGASDMPLKPDDLEASGLVQFPMIMGGTVPVVNLPGIQPGQLTLDGQILADIFQGSITNWNDPKIAALNSGVSLPDKAIAVVHRSDGSGTTFLFTTYLSQASSDWSGKVGASSSVEWPVGIGAKGNEGVANMAKQTDGAIGYVEYAYAKQNNLTYTKMVNKDGKVVEPSIRAFQSAAAGADWANAPGYYLILTNQAGADSWPITGASFILLYKNPIDPAATLTALKFFDWAYKNGGDMAQELAYVPMPANVVDQVRQTWAGSIKDSIGKQLWSADQ
jgi:phosphate transport system substrate-binding protein